MSAVLILIFACACLNEVQSAKILGVFPIASISHQVVFQPIWQELSLRGHEVTVITPSPLNDPQLTNLTEIDLGLSYKILRDLDIQTTMFKDLPITTTIEAASDMVTKMGEAMLSHPEVQALIKDKNRHFDLLLAEFFVPAMFPLSARFGCPMIGILSMSGLASMYDAVGNPAHPALNPDIFLPITDETLGFFSRIYSTFFAIWIRYYYKYHFIPKQDKLARQYIHDDFPYLGDIHNNVSMLFVNVNPITHRIRPNVPAVIELGTMHLAQKKPLPSDLQKILDESAEGVIYFSLGSNVRSSNLSNKLRKTIIDTLSELPYKVLWKWETDHVPGQPRNIIINKWFPQQDVLGHPNIKVFVSQGGLQSIEEAISNGVPLVGMPFFTDQPSNVAKMVHLGIAKAVDPETVTKDELKAAITEVAENPKYRERAREICNLILDVPMTGLEKAVWWSEYVIRHKGARHLRSPAIDMPWYHFLLLDVLGFAFAILLAVIYVLYKTASLAFKTARRFQRQTKTKSL